MKKLLFLGAGGVGGYFGARLLEAGVDVSFLVRPARAALLAGQGLRVSSPHGDLALPVRCVTRDTVQPEYDLVLLAPKAYDLEDALDSIEPAVGPGTFVMPFLNGLAHHGTKGEVGHVMVVHHVEMDPIGASGDDVFDFFTQTGKVGGEYGGGDTVGHAPSLMARYATWVFR